MPDTVKEEYCDYYGHETQDFYGNFLTKVELSNTDIELGNCVF